MIYRNVKFQSPIPLVSNETFLHRTFLDTVGRTALKLTAMNVVDESRDQDLLVTYDYSFSAAFLKPLTIFGGIFAIYVGAWVIGQLDVSIGKPSS